MFSNFDSRFILCGSQTSQAYSRIGGSITLYAMNFVSTGAYLKFPRRYHVTFLKEEERKGIADEEEENEEGARMIEDERDCFM